MARSNNSFLLHSLRGQIGKQIVMKRYGKQTVVTAYPDMSQIKPSKLQKQKRKRFAEAVAYAQSVLYNPPIRAAYAKKLKKGEKIYTAAIREYLQNH